jgi:DNA-binding transcriptional LysR family regulator
MRIEDMEVFCDVVRYRSFSRSAEDRRLSQPGVSWSVRQLENQLGVPLIDRSRRPWRLTSEGQTFFKGCADFLDRYRRLERDVRHARARPDVELRVAAIYSVGPGSLNRILRCFAERHRGTTVRLEYLPPDRVVRRVQSGAADLGILSLPRPHPGLTIVPWKEEPMMVACPPEHPLAAVPAVLPSALHGEAFIGFDRDLEIRRHVDGFLARNGVRVRVTLEFDNIEAIKRAVEAGSGVSILPRPTLERELKMGTLRAVPFLAHRLSRPIGIIHRRTKRLSPGAAQFILLLLGEGDKPPSPEQQGQARHPLAIIRPTAHAVDHEKPGITHQATPTASRIALQDNELQ